MTKLYFKLWVSTSSAKLLAKGIDTAGLDAQLILSFCTGLSRVSLLAKSNNDYTCDPLTIAQCNLLLDLRLKGYPIAYLIGYREFYHHKFFVCPGVLIPRPDSECLIEAITATYDKTSQLTVRDVGTGSGALALTIAQLYPKWDMTASDISPTSQVIFQKNCELLQVKNSRFLKKPLLAGGSKFYDIVVANLPYLTPKETYQKKKIEHWREPSLALNGKGKDGLKLIKKLIREACSRCRSIYLEADPAQMPALQEYLQKYGFSKTQIYHDLNGSARIIFGAKVEK